jgi:hypothetical protein
MNEQIRKIAIEADAWCDKYYFGDKFYDIEWEKKFAQLIVKAVFDRIADERFEVYEPVVKSVKEHFGVDK